MRRDADDRAGGGITAVRAEAGKKPAARRVVSEAKDRGTAASQSRRPVQLAAGDRLKLKKKHPCGGAEFEVVRTGMDIRLRCLTCGSQIVLTRRKLEKMTVAGPAGKSD